jgi:N-acetylmuramic acid 6-phosphate etherase
MPQHITEQKNPASVRLEEKSATEILRIMNREDRKVAPAVGKVIPQIARAVKLATRVLGRGGRMVYLGAGTSGRLGVLDAAECLPTFNTTDVIAVLAGGPRAMFRPAEGTEDDAALARRDLRRIGFSQRDLLVGLSASGRTPYTLGGMRYARSLGAKTIGVTSNPAGPIRQWSDVAIVAVTGPEVIAGSSRLKAGTAEKLVLNMLSTAAMARLGRTLSGLMISVRISNRKLRERGELILCNVAGVKRNEARRALAVSGGKLPVALLMLLKKISAREARRLLARGKNPAAVARQAMKENAAGRLRPKR